MVLPEVSQRLCGLCLPLLGRVMLRYDLLYPAGGDESLNEFAISHIIQLLPVKIPIHKV